MNKTPFIIAAALAGVLGLASCGGGIGLGSILGPELAAKPTEQDRQKLGEAGKRLDTLKKRADTIVNDPTRKQLSRTEVLELVALEDTADNSLSIWGRDPRDTKERLTALEAITNFERFIILLESNV